MLSINKPWPLRTPRLEMVPLCLEDWDFFAALHRDPLVLRYFADPRTGERVREDFISRLPAWNAGSHHWLCLVIRERATGAPVGLTGLIRRDDGIGEVGYLLAPAFHGRGYGSESLNGLCDFAFRQVSLRKLTATVTLGNQASRRILEKAGFQLEGTLRENYWLGARWQDDWIFGLLASEWR